MRVNEHTKLIGNKIILVPYREGHVAKYHAWMQDEELRCLTASERLSLEDEYTMQQKWQSDQDKCTFIILNRSLLDCSGDEASFLLSSLTKFNIFNYLALIIISMIGDVNIFIRDEIGELTTMIAESVWRRMGFGSEAIRMMLRYAIEVIGIRKFEVKISENNTASQKFFQKIGFKVASKCEKFHEYTLSVDYKSVLQIIASSRMKYEIYP
ncbi:unnamed protein product [Thelazia callipaeda]|uniref:N-acetyltransferase domain-containing protein n=1 Tax=Thelazia callipaeda TaxID=103827 RepID=A0A0N5CJK8_THECL|nr:unnamed protein product [Thelazia callipaeda]